MPDKPKAEQLPADLPGRERDETHVESDKEREEREARNRREGKTPEQSEADKAAEEAAEKGEHMPTNTAPQFEAIDRANEAKAAKEESDAPKPTPVRDEDAEEASPKSRS